MWIPAPARPRLVRLVFHNLEFSRFMKHHHAAEVYREFLLPDAAAALFPQAPGSNIKVVLKPVPLYPGGTSTPAKGSNPRFGSVELYVLW